VKHSNSQLTYRGYTGDAQFSAEDNVFWGRIEGIRATVTYEARDVDSLVSAFKESVDDYLEMCAEEGIEPEKPFKGTFNVRVSSDLHRQLAHYAQVEKINLNSATRRAIEHFLASKKSAARE